MSRRQQWVAVGAGIVLGVLVVALFIVAWIRVNDALNQVAGDRQQVRTVQGVVRTVQNEVLEVPCLRNNAACRNFLSLLIANATKRQIRRLLRQAHRLRRHPSSAILRGAKAVHPAARHRRARVPTLKPRPPTRLPGHHHRPQRTGGGGSHGNGPPPGHGNGLPGRPAPLRSTGRAPVTVQGGPIVAGHDHHPA